MRPTLHHLICLLVLAAIASATRILAADQSAEKVYKLVQIESGKVLAVNGDGDADGEKCVLADDDNSDARQWIVKKDGDILKFLNRKSGKALDVYDALTAEDTPIIIWPDKAVVENGIDRSHQPGGLENQFWLLDGTSKELRLKSKLTGLVLDVDAGGGIVQRNADPQAKSQRWRLVDVKNPDLQFAAVAFPAANTTAVGQPVLHLANGDFATGQLLDGDDPKTLRWQSPAFARPLDFKLQSASGIHFPVPKAATKPTGEFGVELLGGDMLFGSLVSLTKDTLALDVPQIGLVHIDRSQVCRLERRRDSSDFVYFGPNGLQNWTQSGDQKLWREEAGELVADSPALPFKPT